MVLLSGVVVVRSCFDDVAISCPYIPLDQIRDRRVTLGSTLEVWQAQPDSRVSRPSSTK
jgi:hypothetical protein